MLVTDQHDQNHYRFKLGKSTVKIFERVQLLFPDCIVLVLLFEGFSWELIKLNENLRLQCHVN